MEEIVREPRAPFGRTYVESIAAPRVSWGAILAGAAAMLAVSVLLLALAVAVLSIVTHPSADSLKSSSMALWICAMAATLVGALVGGIVAGYFPGNPRGGVAVWHGFLAWAVALIVSLGFQLVLVRGLVSTTGGLFLDTLAAESTFTPDDEAMGNAPPAAPLPRGITPRPYGPAQPTLGAPTPQAHAGRVALDYLAGAGWSWFGTWFLAGVLAIIGASIGVRRMGRVELLETRVEREPPIHPMTPAPTT
jgi:hypothetical protein